MLSLTIYDAKSVLEILVSGVSNISGGLVYLLIMGSSSQSNLRKERP
jgi:hypothetical protein